MERKEGRGQGSVRAHNLGLVLRLVEQYPGSSRATVATASGLTRATVSSLVETLTEWGFLQDAGRAVSPDGRTGAGRPGTALELAPRGAAGLGIEVNVDYVATSVVGLDGTVSHSTVRVDDQRHSTPVASLHAAATLATETLAAAEAAGIRVVGACVALPGLVRPAEGRLVVAPNLGWRDVDVVGILRRNPTLAQLPITVDNEANCGALAELRASRAEGTDAFLYVSGEIGIGAALVVDGGILRGTNGWSGELGHVSVDPDGPLCTCGSRGCLEQYAGQEAILRAAGEPGTATTAHALAPSIEHVARLARSGSPSMLRALHDAGAALGVALSAAVNLLDITDVVLGGSFRTLAPWLQPEVVRELDRRVVSREWTDLTVRASTYATEAAVTGAACSVVASVVDDPASWAPTADAHAVS